MSKNTTQNRYEGFAVDLADKLAGILHFNHTFRIVADKKVPSFLLLNIW